MPGPEYAGQVVFYEDFPYAWWNDFRTLDELGPDAVAGLPAGVSLFPAYADISDQLERKITGISIYESQIERLFDGTRAMADAVRAYGAATRRSSASGRAGRALLGDEPRLSRWRPAGAAPTA